MAASPLALLVDHDPDTLELYSNYFELESWRTDRADDGSIALVKAVEAHPDLIVTETWLPGLDGIRFVEILKADPSTKDIPILALTADVREEEIDRARRAGCARVFTKPCLPEELVRAAVELRRKSGELRARVASVQMRAEDVVGRSVDTHIRLDPVRRRHRMPSVRTVEPPVAPPALLCPACGTPLVYECSYLGGVARLREQWDYLNCPRGCARFQYRHRTKRLREL